LLERPIFIVSPPRCGTSLLYRLIGDHPDVGYFSRANKKFPEFPAIAHYLTRVGFYRDSKRESRAIWDRFRGRGSDAMGREDVDEAMRDWYTKTIERVLVLRGAKRFVAKLPAFAQRVEWLDALFPGALFVQILRDWRCVIASSFEKAAREGRADWFGLRVLREEQVRAGPPEAVAAQHLLAAHALLEQASRGREARYLRFWYEDLCCEPAATLRDVFAFTDLPLQARLEAVLLRQVKPLTEHWRSNLGPAEIAVIRDIAGDALRKIESPRIGDD